MRSRGSPLVCLEDEEAGVLDLRGLFSIECPLVCASCGDLGFGGFEEGNGAAFDTGFEIVTVFFTI
jgi:hypothetical protein